MNGLFQDVKTYSERQTASLQRDQFSKSCAGLFPLHLQSKFASNSTHAQAFYSPDGYGDEQTWQEVQPYSGHHRKRSRPVRLADVRKVSRPKTSPTRETRQADFIIHWPRRFSYTKMPQKSDLTGDTHFLHSQSQETPRLHLYPEYPYRPVIDKEEAEQQRRSSNFRDSDFRPQASLSSWSSQPTSEELLALEDGDKAA